MRRWRVGSGPPIVDLDVEEGKKVLRGEDGKVFDKRCQYSLFAALLLLLTESVKKGVFNFVSPCWLSPTISLRCRGKGLLFVVFFFGFL